jgi:DNA repair photolyase
MPAILAAAADAGASTAGYVMLRLPHAVKDLFLQWLDDHAPAKKARILDRIRAVRGGRLYRSEWGSRMTGEGIFAEQAGELFRMGARKAGLNLERRALAVAHFRRPGGVQLEML